MCEMTSEHLDSPEAPVLTPTSSEFIEVPEDPYADDNDDKRLWIGNLDTRMTEFAILKLVQKFGSIRKMDCIYHKTGPDKGKSKGYCFVSFRTWEAAEKARKTLDGKMIMSRMIYVKWARSSKQNPVAAKTVAKCKPKPTEQTPAPSLPPVAAAALSLSSSLAMANTATKIEAIEAKLRLMEEGEKDVSIDTILKPYPGFKPTPSGVKANTHRTAPYRKIQKGDHRKRWK